MTAPTLEVRIDFDDDGTFEAGIEDVTAYVFGSIEISRGRDQVRALSPAMAPQMTLVLDNGDGRFWPDKVSSPLYPNVRDQHRIRVTATHSATTYTMFVGTITDWALDFDLELVTVTAMGGVEALVEATITTPLYSGITTGEAIDLILDEIDWPAGSSYRTISTGATILPWWWETNGGAYPALLRVVACEGPPARIDINTEGKFIFEDRHHRLITSGGGSVSATFLDTGAEPLMTRPFEINLGWDTIINDVTIPVETLTVGDEQEVGTWFGSQAVTGGGGSVVVTMNLDTPIVAGPVNSPTVGNGGIVAIGIGSVTGIVTLTSAQTVTVQLQSPDFDATVTEIHLFGRPLLVGESVDVTYTDAASVTEYGSRGIPGGLDATFLNKTQAAAVAQVYVDHYEEPLQQVHITIDGAHDTRLPFQLGLDVSDRVRVEVSEASVATSYYIEQVGTTFNLPHPWTTTRFGCEARPTFTVPSDSVFILNSSTQGRLAASANQGLLGL